MAPEGGGKGPAQGKVSEWAQEENERTMAMSRAITVSAQIPGAGAATVSISVITYLTLQISASRIHFSYVLPKQTC